MKSFKEYLIEGGVPVVSTQREIKANLDDPTTVDELNRFLSQVTAGGFVNPYSALQMVSKTLSTYGIILPSVTYLPEPAGEEVFEVQQWGVHPGYSHLFNDKSVLDIQTNTGIVPYQNVKSDAEEGGESLYVYFCYEMNENGIYEVFCIVVDNEGLETILGESLEDEGEELEETKGWRPHTKSAAKAWGSLKGIGNKDEIERLKPSTQQNDTTFKNWRKEIGTDRDTTRKIVDKK